MDFAVSGIKLEGDGVQVVLVKPERSVPLGRYWHPASAGLK